MKKLPVTGYTPEGEGIVGGVYWFYETHGLPLPMLIDLIRKKGLWPDWYLLYLDAVKEDFSFKKIRSVTSLICGSITDCFKKETADEIKRRFHRMVTMDLKRRFKC